MGARTVIGGMVPFTTIDFPGKLAAVLFCQGCPWRCAYCHNPHLLPFQDGTLAWEEVIAFLQSRRGLLEAVVFSGGEPLAQTALLEAMDEVRALGFAVGMHTAGSSPRRLRAVLGRVDWVGFDVKAPFARYGEIAGVPGGRVARASLVDLLASGVAHEVRTTVDVGVLDRDALLVMADELATLGVRRWSLQRCRGPQINVDDGLADTEMLARLGRQFDAVTVR